MLHSFKLLTEQAISYILDIYHHENIWSFIIKVLIGVIISIFGFMGKLHIAFGMLAAIDWITGNMKARKLKTLSSEKGRLGREKRQAQIIIIAVCGIVDNFPPFANKWDIFSCIIVAHIVTEDFWSILENLEPFGLKLTPKIRNILKKHLFDGLDKNKK